MTEPYPSQLDNGISAADIPDSIKPIRWWKLQQDIARVKPGTKLEGLLLTRQKKMERELYDKAQKLRKEGKL